MSQRKRMSNGASDSSTWPLTALSGERAGVPEQRGVRFDAGVALAVFTILSALLHNCADAD